MSKVLYIWWCTIATVNYVYMAHRHRHTNTHTHREITTILWYEIKKEPFEKTFHELFCAFSFLAFAAAKGKLSERVSELQTNMSVQWLNSFPSKWGAGTGEWKRGKKFVYKYIEGSPIFLGKQEYLFIFLSERKERRKISPIEEKRQRNEQIHFSSWKQFLECKCFPLRTNRS